VVRNTKPGEPAGVGARSQGGTLCLWIWNAPDPGDWLDPIRVAIESDGGQLIAGLRPEAGDDRTVLGFIFPLAAGEVASA
jgi:hypothetical protein